MQKNMINFIKFIIDEFGEVEFEGEAVVVGVSLGELLWLRDAVDNLNFRHDDLLFFRDRSCFRLGLRIETDH